ncbi:MAG: anti-sigma factor domain-containing protein [Gemmobacter sp.]
MSRTPATLPPDEFDALAAEYALGVLDAADRAAAEARMAADPAFAEAVAAWAARLAPMDAAYAEVPAPNLMPAIEARLFGRAEPAPAHRGWRSWLAGALAGAALTAAAVVAVVLVAPPAAVPTLTATLTGDAPVTFAATWDGSALTVVRTAGTDPAEGQDYELWLIAGEAAPVSLGLLRGRAVARPLDDLPAGAILAVSLEPAGGSATGAPTGPVLALGTLG